MGHSPFRVQFLDSGLDFANLPFLPLHIRGDGLGSQKGLRPFRLSGERIQTLLGRAIDSARKGFGYRVCSLVCSLAQVGSTILRRVFTQRRRSGILAKAQASWRGPAGVSVSPQPRRADYALHEGHRF